ncbi:MAG TPA: alpha/beta hydrolase [Methylomirabilota bacterium]|nr:alpha/beta hydrolase [Methylomirabilota bacterium]
MTDREYLDMEKSTIVRSSKDSRLLPIVRTAHRVLSAAAPALAARRAARLFTTPPPVRRPSAEIDLLGTARARPMHVGGRRVETYTWGAGPAVLLVHGWGGRGAQLGSFVGPLVARGFSVVAFDAPGHGASELGTVTIPEITDAIRAVADSRGPLAALIAHSIGATAAVRALWDGLDAGAVVLVGPSADLTTPALRFSETLGFSRDVRERMHRVIEERVGRSWSVFDALELAPGLTVPALVVHDRGDAEVPWQHGAALARAWRGSEMLMTEGLGHRRILRDPDVVAAAVAFVAARTAERGIAATVDADPQATPLEILMAG